MLQADRDPVIRDCPVCEKTPIINWGFRQDDGGMAYWFRCFCGSMFQEGLPVKEHFNDEYREKMEKVKFINRKYEHLMRLYVPLIEEMVTPARFFDVGFGLPHNIKYMNQRGWLSTGIDLIPNDYVNGDFESFETDDRFDFILMGHVLESFDNPIKALEKAYSFLSPRGVVLVTTPAPESIFLNDVGITRFNYFNTNSNHIFMSKEEIVRIAFRLGLDVVHSHFNESRRLAYNNDWHILLRKVK